MGAFIFNIAKGKWGRYAELAAAGTGGAELRWILFQGTDETDATLKDLDDVPAIIATALDEATFTNYTQGGLAVAQANVSVTTDDTTTDSVFVDITADPEWTSGSVQQLRRILLVFDPDGTHHAPPYTGVIPIFMDDFGLNTPASGSVKYQVATSGPLKAS